MTSAIYLASMEPAGKTALAAAIGQRLVEQGKKVGYFIPLEISESGHNYEDASFLKNVLELNEDVAAIAPVHKTAMSLWKTLAEDSSELIDEIKKCYTEIAEDKDFVLIEGLSGLTRDGDSTLACYRISEALNVPVMLILRYSDALDPAAFEKVKKELGNRLAGVVINFVPARKLELVKKQAVASFSRAGIKVLGLICEDRTLAGVSVAALARDLGAELITARENTAGIVENIMLASLPLDSAANYFNRKPNKAVVIRSERYDTQLAALETSTACLVLTGDTEPQSMVTNFAEEKKIPVMLVRKETDEVLAGLEVATGLKAFNSRDKLARLQQLLESWDWSLVYSAIGLAR
jgi:uncharacterized protein